MRHAIVGFAQRGVGRGIGHLFSFLWYCLRGYWDGWRSGLGNGETVHIMMRCGAVRGVGMNGVCT